MRLLTVFYLVSLTTCFFRCSIISDSIKDAKLKCYDKKLNELKISEAYENLMIQFRDTFKIMRANTVLFGVPEVVENKIDEAIFFNKEKTMCLLLVLERDNPNVMFGGARIIHGFRIQQNWSFEVGMHKSFENDYFELYSDNSFENISKIARASVMTDGAVDIQGCEIDEYYWFTQMLD